MKVLFLSPHIHLIDYLISFGDDVTQTTEPLTDDMVKGKNFIVSYGYRHIISKEVLDKFENSAINLHLSYLPWNRGADPNLWSFLENTPKGVSIHFLDEGIDTGDIIAQRYVMYNKNDTLRTSYARLTESLEDLFQKVWPYVRNGEARRYPQSTYHCLQDKAKYEHLLINNWDTPVRKLIGKGAKNR
jgi:methionyl-tRNA formyltransferase